MHQGWHLFYTYPQGKAEYDLATLLHCMQHVSDLLRNKEVFPPTHLPAHLGKGRSITPRKHHSTEQVCTANSKRCCYLPEVTREIHRRTEISQMPYLKCSCDFSHPVNEWQTVLLRRFMALGNPWSQSPSKHGCSQPEHCRPAGDLLLDILCSSEGHQLFALLSAVLGNPAESKKKNSAFIINNTSYCSNISIAFRNCFPSLHKTLNQLLCCVIVSVIKHK